jgi:hypothetical protein
VGIGVCAYETRDSNLKPGLFTHFPDSAIGQRFSGAGKEGQVK